MSTIINQEKHKENLKELGSFGAKSLGFFIVVYLAIYVNITYTPGIPWFIIIIVVGSFMLVPKAKVLIKKFEDNSKQY